MCLLLRQGLLKQLGKPGRLGKHGFALTLGIGLLLLGLSSCASASSTTVSPTATALPTTAPSPTSAVTSCQTTQLTLGLQSQQSGASNFANIYSLKNTSPQSCTLNGYPDVLLLSATQSQLAIPNSQQTSAYFYNNAQPQLVTLAPAASAYFILEWNAGVNGSGTCPGAAYVSVAPPGSQTHLRLASSIDVCTGFVIVSPIEATAFGY